ncbi:MAG: glycosyltransferase [Acutalibacteraceae bacterium]|jgi:rhamnosyltransferase
MKIYVIVVVYNKTCRNSVTCNSLFTTTGNQIYPFIIDNSTSNFGNEAYCAEKGWQYCSMNGNKGLSRAYNRALDLLHPTIEDLIVLADDDTEFPENYFSELIYQAKMRPSAAVFLPIVLSSKRMISPALYGKYRIRAVNAVEELSGRKITAINSGMAVRAEIYQSYRYDERLFLDYIDHDFMQWCRQNKKEVCIMERVTLKQTFFSDSRPKRDKALFRQKIFSKDFRRYASKWGNNRVITELQILKRRIHLELTCDRH